MLTMNAKAKCILVCALGPNEYSHISGCTTTKQIWGILVNAQEGTPQLRKFGIARLCTKYEAFKMESGESLQDIITRFIIIVNGVVSLGKIC